MGTKTAASPTRTVRTPRRGRPPDVEARGRILEALRRLLETREYESLSVELLIREAGLSRASYYKHFESKEQALVALFTEVATDVQQRVMAAAARGRDLASLLDEAITEYFKAIVSLGRLAPAFNAAQFRSPEMLASREAMLQDYEAKLTALLRSAGLAPIPPLFMDALFAAVDRMGQRLAASRLPRASRDARVEQTMSELRALVRDLLQRQAAPRTR
jgi:AcrR family transcriptional regulator